MELIIDHPYVRKPPQESQKCGIWRASRLANTSIYQEGSVSQLYRTEAPMFKTLPDLALHISSSDYLSLFFITSLNKLVNPIPEFAEPC